nr:MAG TPA: HNH endonuclease [Caudoviricetes sp.]
MIFAGRSLLNVRVILNAYHWDKKNRLNPDNAVVLCKKCHLTFHKIYGQKYNTEQQFKEFYETPTL